MRQWAWLLIFLIFPLRIWAVDLEEAPSGDLAQVDHEAAELSIKDLVTEIKFDQAFDSPHLDGVLDDQFWKQAKHLTITKELYPRRFADALVNTDVLAAVTKTHLYMGITAHDPNPEELRSKFRERDGVKEDDYVSVVIDPTGNLRRKFEFRVNPHGVQTDVLQNTVSNRYIYDWDTRWRAEASITDSAYIVEMEIPINSLKQPRRKDGKIPRWLVMLKRTYPRRVDRTFGSIYLFEKGFESGQEGRDIRLELQPYYIYHLDEEKKDSGFEQVSEHDEHEAGFDSKLIIDTATTVGVTVNPNYTEVEADIARDSINNSFNPFKPEKRKIFQDTVDLFSTFMPIMYTRNIVNPSFGIGASHTGQKTSTGGFWFNDDKTELFMPDNLGSDRVKVKIPGKLFAFRHATGEKGSSLGVLATTRTGDNYHNAVAGVDGLYNLGIDDKLRFQLTYSSTDYPEEFADDLCEDDDCLLDPPVDDCPKGGCSVNPYVLRANPTRDLKGHGIRLGYKHDSPDNLYWVNYFDYADDFRADSGFEKRTDYRLINVAYGRNWFINTLRRDEGESRVRAYLVGTHIESSDGDDIENGGDVWGEFRGSFQTVFRIGYRLKERAVNRIQQNSLDLGDNAPLFDESYWQWYYEASPINEITFNLDGRYGDIADPENLVLGRMMELKPKIRFDLGKFKFELAHTHRDYQLDGSNLYTENFSTIKLGYHFNDDQSFRLLFLKDKTKRDVERFLEDELRQETEKTLEFTYLHRRYSGLFVMFGAKFIFENDSSIDDEFTDERQVYFKLGYDFNEDFSVPTWDS